MIGYPPSPSYRGDWQRDAYLEAMGREETTTLYIEGVAAQQWRYGTKASNKAQDAAIFYAVTGAEVPKKSAARKPQLSPLDRVRKAVAARKRAENEYKRALQACKGLSVTEVAQAAQVSRQRVYQVSAQ